MTLALGSAQARVYEAMDSEWRTRRELAERAGMPPENFRMALISLVKYGLAEHRLVPGEGSRRGHMDGQWRRVRCPASIAGGRPSRSIRG